MAKFDSKLLKKDVSDLPTATSKKPIKKLSQTEEIDSLSETVSRKTEDTSAFYAFCYRLTSKRIGFFYERFVAMDKKIKTGGMNVYYKAYISGLVVMSTLMGIIGVAMGAVLGLVLHFDPPEFGMILPLILGASLGQGTFGVMYMMPGLQQKSRHSRIVQELPYYMGYMATLSASGLTLEGIFKALAQEDSKEEIVKDAKIMIRNLEVLGMDVLSALRELSERSPAEPYTELLEGMISTVQSGGNLKEFFISTAKVQMEEKKLLLKKMTASLGVVAEMYTILLIVFPLLAAIILSIMAIMVPSLGGFDLVMLMQLLTYGFVPFLGAMMLFMIDAMVPKR